MSGYSPYVKYMTQEKQNEIVQKLNCKRVVFTPCSRCGSGSYRILEASSRYGAVLEPVNHVVEIPCVLVVCQKCGFVSEFFIAELYGDYPTPTALTQPSPNQGTIGKKDQKPN